MRLPRSQPAPRRTLITGLIACAAALIAAGVPTSPAFARQQTGRTTVELAGMCRGLVLLGVNADADCQPDLTLNHHADGQVHFAVVVGSTCCAMIFRGRTTAYLLEDGTRVQPIDHLFYYRANATPLSEPGQGDCRWLARTAGPVTLTCRLVSADDGARVTQLVFDAADGGAFDGLFEASSAP